MRRSEKPICTYIVIGICVTVTILFYVLPFSGNQTEKAVLMGAFYKALIIGGEWFRMLTCGFLHTSVWHLAMNMMSLLMLGSFTEHVYGRWQFMFIMIGSVLGGSLFMLVKNGNTVALGLSAGLYGLMASYFVSVVKAGGLENPHIRNNLLQILGINLLINFMPGVAYIGHIGGLVTGLLLSLIVNPDPGFANVRIHAIISTILLILGIVLYSIRTISIPENERYLATDCKILRAEAKMGLEHHALRVAKNLDDFYGYDYLKAYLIMEGYND